MITTRLTLPMPPGVNSMYRTWRGRILLSAKGRAYKEAAAFAARAQGAHPILGALSVTVRIYRPRRAGDIDGYLKGCLDALNGIAWEDDSQIVELHAVRHDDKANPRVEVVVYGEAGPRPEPKPKRQRKSNLAATPNCYRRST